VQHRQLSRVDRGQAEAAEGQRELGLLALTLVVDLGC
jgi:hypothetical protein